MVASITVPCSVNAKGGDGENFKLPRLSQFVISSFHSSLVIWNMKSDGNRFRFLRTCCFKIRVSTPIYLCQVKIQHYFLAPDNENIGDEFLLPEIEFPHSERFLKVSVIFLKTALKNRTVFQKKSLVFKKLVIQFFSHVNELMGTLLDFYC